MVGRLDVRTGIVLFAGSGAGIDPLYVLLQKKGLTTHDVYKEKAKTTQKFEESGRYLFLWQHY